MRRRKLDVDPYVMGAFVGSRDVMNGNLGIKAMMITFQVIAKYSSFLEGVWRILNIFDIQ